MRSMLLAMLALVCLVLPAHAQAAECDYTEAQFLANAGHAGIDVWSANGKALAAFVTMVNDRHAAQGAPPVEADGAHYIKVRIGSRSRVAVLLSKDQCAVPGGAFLVLASQWEDLLSSRGLADSDFALEQGL